LPIPKAIADAPELAQGLAFYYIAYQDISTGREYTQAGPVPLSWFLVHTWCKAYDLDVDEEEDVQFHVLRLDDFHRDWMKKRKTSLGKGEQPSGHQPPKPAHPKNSKRHRRQR
jgi:hypothetical protein